jgi:hypothetical protein
MEAKRSIDADPKCPECHKSEIMDIFLKRLTEMQTHAGQGTVFPLNGVSERAADGPILLTVVLAPS